MSGRFGAAVAVLALGAAVLFGASVAGAQQCGDATGDSAITAADALVALRTATGGAQCARCVCDVDRSGAVVASDALTVLERAVGEDVALDCPACGETTTTTVSTTTTTTRPKPTTTLPPAKVACGDSHAPAPNCDGYCGVNSQMCVEDPPGSGVCQCIFGPTCGAAGGPPVCAGACHALWVCKDVGGACRCVN